MNISEKIKHEFKKFPEVEIVILFGSAAKNRLIRQSDIDIAFAQKTITTHEKKVDIYISPDLVTIIKAYTTF